MKIIVSSSVLHSFIRSLLIRPQHLSSAPAIAHHTVRAQITVLPLAEQLVLPSRRASASLPARMPMAVDRTRFAARMGLRAQGADAALLRGLGGGFTE